MDIYLWIEIEIWKYKEQKIHVRNSLSQKSVSPNTQKAETFQMPIYNFIFIDSFIRVKNHNGSTLHHILVPIQRIKDKIHRWMIFKYSFINLGSVLLWFTSLSHLGHLFDILNSKRISQLSSIRGAALLIHFTFFR